jgi:hypothetical protein
MKLSDILTLLINSGLLAVLLGFATRGIKAAKEYADTKAAEATAKIKDTNERNAINAVEQAATTVVAKLAQTSVDSLKAASADGKLTAADAVNIKAAALNQVQALLTDDVTQTIHTILKMATRLLTRRSNRPSRRLAVMRRVQQAHRRLQWHPPHSNSIICMYNGNRPASVTEVGRFFCFVYADQAVTSIWVPMLLLRVGVMLFALVRLFSSVCSFVFKAASVDFDCSVF